MADKAEPITERHVTKGPKGASSTSVASGGEAWVQYVNVSRDENYAKSYSESLPHLGGLVDINYTMKVDDEPACIRVTIEATGDNAVYTDAETKRRNNYTNDAEVTKTAVATSPDKIQTHVIELPAAGMNTYKISAKYNADVLHGELKVTTKRIIHYQCFVLDGADVFDPQSALEKAYTSAGIVFKKVADPIHIDSGNKRKNWDDDQIEAIFNAKMKSTVKADQDRFAKYLPIIFAYSNDWSKVEERELSVPSRNSFINTIKRIVQSDPKITIKVRASKDLFVDPDGSDKGYWLIGAVLSEKNDPTKLSLVDLDFKQTGVNQMECEFPFSRFEDGKDYVISLRYRIVGGSAAGGMMPSIDALLITTGDGTDRVPCTIVHEMGHALLLAANGGKSPPVKPEWPVDARALDMHATYYDKAYNNHQGGHCMVGVSFRPDNARKDPLTGQFAGTPGCAMFGAIGYRDASGTNHDSPDTLCAECAKHARRISFW